MSFSLKARFAASLVQSRVAFIWTTAPLALVVLGGCGVSDRTVHEGRIASGANADDTTQDTQSRESDAGGGVTDNGTDGESGGATDNGADTDDQASLDDRAEAETDNGTDAETGGGTGAEASNDTDAETGSATDDGTDAETGGATDNGTDAELSSGTDATDNGTDAELSSGTDAMDDGTDAETDALTDTEIGGASRVPSLVGYSEFHDSASGPEQASSRFLDATFETPDGTQEGDFLLVFFGSDHTLLSLDQDTLTDTNWTLQAQESEYGEDGQGAYVLSRFAVADEPASLVFKDINSSDYGNGVQGLLLVYRGVNRETPVNALEKLLQPPSLDTVKTVSTPTPAIETTVAGCLAIAGLSPDTAIDAPTIDAWPAGFTQNQLSVVNPKNPYPYGWANIYTAEQPLLEAGVLAPSEFTWTMQTGTQNYGALSFVIALAPEE